MVYKVFQSYGKNPKPKWKYIRVTSTYAYLSNSNKKYGGHYIFSPSDIIDLFNFLVDNSFIKFNGKIYRQYTGISMGIDPAPFVANLFLHQYENNYIHKLIDEGEKARAKSLSNCSRYLDDLLCLNDKGVFEEVYKDIYPREMKLSKTNNDNSMADYLDLYINIVEIDGRNYFSTNLYDKRHAFSFQVIKYPCLKHSNIPNSPAYGIFISQLIRMARVCSEPSGFTVASSRIFKDLIMKGFAKVGLDKKN